MTDLVQTILNVGLALVIIAMVTCVSLAVWLTKRRHKSYEHYLAAKRKIEQGTMIGPRYRERKSTLEKE